MPAPSNLSVPRPQATLGVSTPAPDGTRGRRWIKPGIRAIAVVFSCAVLMAAAACGDDDSDTATNINATLGDGTIDLNSASSSGAGVLFAIENTGELAHEFLVLKTDLPEDQLPLNSDESAVDEAASGISVEAEREDISPGSSTELEVDDLESGDYVLICNVPGHYNLGMHASFTVE